MLHYDTQASTTTLNISSQSHKICTIYKKKNDLYTIPALLNVKTTASRFKNILSGVYLKVELLADFKSCH